MKLSEVYRQAAKKVEELIEAGAPAYSCCEVWAAFERLFGWQPEGRIDVYIRSRTDDFARLFSKEDPGAALPRSFWLRREDFESEEERNAFRVTALCFMAAILEEEGL